MKRFLLISFLFAFLSFSQAPAQGFWESVKEKAKSAWNSDTRKDAWKKTKEAAKKTKEAAKKAWESDTRKEAWKKTKETAKKAWDSDTRKNAWKKTEDVADKALGDYQYTVPITGRKFVNVIPDKQLLSMSNSQYRSYLAKSKLANSTAKGVQVRRVGQRLAAAVSRFYSNQGRSSELSNFDWEFNFVQGSTVNAFCMPGGKIVVYEGIMKAATDDNSLAIVLGHEIAHAIAKHSAEQMTKKVVGAVGVAAIYAMICSSDMSANKKKFAALITSAGATLAALKFSRIDETEADRLGLIIAAMAGYNPEAAIPFWQRMGKLSGAKGKHDFYSTHPSNSNRIANIQSFLPEAKRYYR